MTREEAVTVLNAFMDNPLFSDAHKQALNMAIEALEKEPCDGAISRQEVLEQINWWIGSGEYRYTNATYYLTRRIKELPPVSPQQKIGWWIFDEIVDKHYFCSECKSMGADYWDYCPYCGAKMQEVEG